MGSIKMTVHTPQFSKGEEARDPFKVKILVGWLLVLLINPNLSFPFFERNERFA